jgi:hypothetical protein
VLRCELPGLLGNGLDIRRDLNLSGSTVTGALATTARAAAADPCGDGQVRCVNPVFYAVDTVVPLVTPASATPGTPTAPPRGERSWTPG